MVGIFFEILNSELRVKSLEWRYGVPPGGRHVLYSARRGGVTHPAGEIGGWRKFAR